MLDVIDLTNTNLASDNLGEMWDDFAVRCTPAAAKLLVEAYNLITLSMELAPEGNNGYLDITITHILIDEGMETSDTIQAIRKILMEGLIDCLKICGIIVDMDYIGPGELPDLITLLDTIYTFNGMDDIFGLADVLEDEYMDPKERFIRVVKMGNPEYDIEKLYTMISEVSVNTTKGMLIGLNILDSDDIQYMEPALKRRLIASKEFLKGTLGEYHIQNGGGVQLQSDVYLTLFGPRLAEYMSEDPVKYVKNILSLFMISDLTPKSIEAQITALSQEVTDDLDTMYRIQGLLKEVNLSE